VARLGLLQGFELVLDGRPVHLPLSGQRVLAFLALQNRPVQRVYVAGSLWLDASEHKANASLRTTLWRRRRRSARSSGRRRRVEVLEHPERRTPGGC
jgi:DNA-binding SARP family transcriptional activator